MRREQRYFHERAVTIIGLIFWAIGFANAWVIWGWR